MKYDMDGIIKSLPEKKEKGSSFWAKLFVRRLSFYVTYIFINLGLSANSVSVISGIVAIVGCISLSINSHEYRVLGVFLINFWLVLDCVDGNIARCKGKTSLMGEFYDAVSGYMISAFSLLAIGIAAYHTSSFMSGIYNEWFIVAGALGSIANILSRLVYHKFTNSRLIAGRKKGNDKEYVPENNALYESKPKMGLTYFRLRVDKQLGISGLFMPALIAAIAVSRFDLFVVFYTFYNVTSLLAVLVLFMWKAKKYQDDSKKTRIGYTAGVFDMFHVGHLNMLKKAKEKCDYLIVAVIADDVADGYKNKKPVIPMEDRIKIVESIRFADKVVPDYSRDRIEALKKYGFNVAFVGDDWKGTERWNRIEAKMGKMGATVEYLPYTEGISSTILRERIWDCKQSD